MAYNMDMKLRFYHTSDQHFRKGQVIGGAYYRGVFMATSPVPHFTILDKAIILKMRVYEVRPLQQVYTGEWLELWTQQAEVIRYVGDARGLINNGGKHKGIKQGSYVHDGDAKHARKHS